MNEELRNQYHECPTIYVSLASEVDEQAYRWVEVGAEEEGVPCLLTPAVALHHGLDAYQKAVALATAAARGSRLGVGVGIAGNQVVLQEAHMPAGQPVFHFPAEQELLPVCRLAGSNAGRMVKRMPLRFEIAKIQPDDTYPQPVGSPAVAQAPVEKPTAETWAGAANGHSPVGQAPAPDGISPDLVNLIVRILAERGLS